MPQACTIQQIPERVVSRWFDAFNARDLDGLLALLDPGVDFYPLKLSGLAGSYRGHDGVRDWFAHLVRQHHDYQIGVCDVRSVVGGKVVAAGSVSLVGELDIAPFRAVHRISGGLILTAHHCLSDPEMIEHLGLIP